MLFTFKAGKRAMNEPTWQASIKRKSLFFKFISKIYHKRSLLVHALSLDATEPPFIEYLWRIDNAKRQFPVVCRS
jgi:hypothetical protein